MAGMTPWQIAALALLPPLGIALVLCARGPVGHRLVAAQLAGAVGLQILVVLTFALQQASSIDLALTLALLTLPGTLLYALVLERWL